MKIVALSDLHGYLPAVPECDVVTISGDIVPCHIQRKKDACIAWFSGVFQTWALNLDCKYVAFVAGNHDFVLQDLDKEYNCFEVCRLLFQADAHYKIRYLLDTCINLDGVNIYGTPWIPSLKNWAFYGDSDFLKETFDLIPEDADIILTHCPPRLGEQGVVLQNNHWNRGANFGCEELRNALKNKFYNRKEPIYVLSGHIHSGKHEIEELDCLRMRNVSIMDEDYEPTYLPYIFEI